MKSRIIRRCGGDGVAYPSKNSGRALAWGGMEGGTGLTSRANGESKFFQVPFKRLTVKGKGRVKFR